MMAYRQKRDKQYFQRPGGNVFENVRRIQVAAEISLLDETESLQ